MDLIAGNEIQIYNWRLKCHGVYTIEVDYNINREEQLQNCDLVYQGNIKNIKSIEQEGRSEVKVRLCNMLDYVESAEDINKFLKGNLQTLKLKPADLTTSIAFWKFYNDIIAIENSLLVLGAAFRDVVGQLRIFYIDRDCDDNSDVLKNYLLERYYTDGVPPYFLFLLMDI